MLLAVSPLTASRDGFEKIPVSTRRVFLGMGALALQVQRMRNGGCWYATSDSAQRLKL